jgi:virginiamycin B lyase
VSRFDPRTGRVGATIDVRLPHEGVFDGPNRVAVGLGGVWVSHPVQDVVTRIDPRSNAVVARVRFPRGAEPLGLAVGAGSLWAVGPKEIFRVDPGTNRVVETARVGTHAGNDYRGLRRIAIAGDTLWVTDGDSDTVDRIAVGR